MFGSTRLIDRTQPLSSMSAVCLLAGVLSHAAFGAGPGVHGRVFALDENGTMVGSVPGATIEFQDSSGAVVARATASASSYYRVDLPPGTYSYKVQAAGYKDEDEGRAINLVLNEGFAVYNFSLIKGKTERRQKPRKPVTTKVGRLQGRVLEKKPDGALVGIPTARIALRHREQGRDLVRVIARNGSPNAEETGRYQVTLNAGDWHASVSATGFEPLVDPQPITIRDGAVTQRDFVLVHRAPEEPVDQGIKGTVTLRQPPTDTLTSLAQPSLDQVELSIAPWGGSEDAGESLHPQTHGQYSQSLPVGAYQVVAKAAGYRPARSRPAFVISGRYTRVNLVLIPDVKPALPAPEIAFEGTVLERSPKPGATRALAGADLLLRAQGQPLATAERGTTDAQGKVRLRVSAAGPYEALAQKSGYIPAGVRVEINPTQDNQAQIILETEADSATPGPVRPVRPTPEEPLPRDPNDTGETVPHHPTDDPHPGRPEVTPERPEVTPERPEVTPQWPEVTPERPEVVPRRRDSLRPLPPVSVRGYVAYADQRSSTGLRAVPGAVVRWTRVSDGRTVDSVRSDRMGHFSVRLPQGRYLAVVTPPSGYQGTQATLEVRPKMPTQRFVIKRLARLPDSETGGGRREQDTGGGHDPRRHTLTVRIVERVSGKVVGSRPVAGAKIAIRRQGRNVVTGASDPAGHFRTQLAPGKYTIDVVRPGYQPGRSILALSGRDVTQEITLRRSAKADGPGQSKPMNRGSTLRPKPSRQGDLQRLQNGKAPQVRVLQNRAARQDNTRRVQPSNQARNIGSTFAMSVWAGNAVPPRQAREPSSCRGCVSVPSNG